MLRKSDERRFSQARGRISQCLAAERRLKGCEATRLAMEQKVSPTPSGKSLIST